MDRKTLTRREFLRWSAVTAGTAALAACAPVPVPAPPTAAPAVEAPTPTPEKVPEAIELTLMSLKGVGWTKFNTALIDDFQARTGHKVTLQEVQWPVRDSLIPAVAAGTPPDVCHDMGKMSGALYANDTYLTLNELLDASPYKRDDFIPIDMDSLTFLGKLKMMPFWHNGLLNQFFIYRKDFFDEAGLPYPPKYDGFGTYPDLMELAKKLVKRDASGNVTRWGFEIDEGWAGTTVLGGVLDLGGKWFDEAKGEFTLNTEPVIQSIQAILIDPIWTYGVCWDEARAPQVDYYERTFEGVVAMKTISWPILIAKDKGLTDMVEIHGWAELPGMAKGKHNRVSEGTWGAGILASAPESHRTAAFGLATASLQPKIARTIMEVAGPASALKSFADDPFLKELAEKDNAGAVTVDNYMMELSDPPVFAGWEWGDIDMFHFVGHRCWGDAGQARSEQTGTIWNGKVTAEQIADEWQQEATRVRKEFYEAAGIKA